MTAPYTCFVISPIGEPHSEVRTSADDTFEYIVRPALERYDFVVERADHIRGITDTITKEMVERIQRSDLCIVDVTGLNPNVMYECGRRHETGRPCIIISRDDSLPFDVVTHPVIKYSLDAQAKDVIKVIREIQQNVKHFVDMGFERVGDRTIGDVYREVSAVGQKLDMIVKRLPAVIPSQKNTSSIGKPSEDGDLIRQMGGVVPAINYALASRDSELLDKLLPRVKNKSSENFISGGLVQGCYLGSKVAFDMLEPVIAFQLDEFGWPDRAQFVSGYSAGASRQDEEGRALPILSAVVERMDEALASGEDIESRDQARILNALQRVCHGLEDYDAALRIGARALELEPDDESFVFNQSLNYQSAGNAAAALELVDRLVELMRSRGFVDADDDHLVHMIRVYISAGKLAEARELFMQLEDQHPMRAQMLRVLHDFSGLFE